MDNPEFRTMDDIARFLGVRQSDKGVKILADQNYLGYNLTEILAAMSFRILKLENKGSTRQPR